MRYDKCMEQASTFAPSYVIRAGELTALNYLARNHTRPCLAKWINRGTDQLLRRTTIDLLLRTFFQEPVSPSIAQLRETTGLRLEFRTEGERSRFAAEFSAARKREADVCQSLVIAIFDDRQSAMRALSEMKRAGIAESAVSLLWRAGQFMKTDRKWPKGHSLLEVAMTVAGGGIASALLAVGLLALPGMGGLVVAGAFAAASGSAGATGAAIAKMLTDLDVDDIAAKFFEQQVLGGKVFVTVDLQQVADQGALARSALRRNGGKIGDLAASARSMPAVRTGPAVQIGIARREPGVSPGLVRPGSLNSPARPAC